VYSVSSASVDTAFRYGFGVGSQGAHTVRVRVEDNEGLADTATLAVTVRSGMPVVSGLSVLPSLAWVRDNNQYTVQWADTNGACDSFEIDWGNDGTYDSKNGTGVFTHMWDTSEAGTHNIGIRVRDDDGQWSSGTQQTTVRLGRPILSGATFGDSIQWVEGSGGGKDTMFYVFGGGNTTMRVDTSDSNGSCSIYYWDFYDDGGVNSVTTTTTSNGFAANTPVDLRVWCKDDDSLTSAPLVCVVYPDAPPPAATCIADKPGDGTLIVYWSNKDVHDGDATEYRILYKKGGSPAETDILVDYRAGSQYESGSAQGYDYRYVFTPTDGNGSYYFKVRSRDARGSTALSNEDSIIYP
jgi:hypothetical protein